MEKIITKIKRWGNSFGVILPAKIVRAQNLEEGAEIEILISLKNKARVRDIFGALKNWKIDAQKFKDEIRGEDKKRDELFSRHLRND